MLQLKFQNRCNLLNYNKINYHSFQVSLFYPDGWNKRSTNMLTGCCPNPFSLVWKRFLINLRLAPGDFKTRPSSSNSWNRLSSASPRFISTKRFKDRSKEFLFGQQPVNFWLFTGPSTMNSPLFSFALRGLRGFSSPTPLEIMSNLYTTPFIMSCLTYVLWLGQWGDAIFSWQNPNILA